MAVSLRTHLLEPGRHPGLPSHPDCPHCLGPPDVASIESRRARAATSRAALAATLLAGSALTTVAAVPVAQAQVEEETEGTESLDGPGDLSPEFEEGPADPEAEREEADVLGRPPEGPDPVGSPDDDAEGGPESTAPGVLNAPAPAEPAPPPPTPPLPPPPGDEGADQVLERPLGQQPRPPGIRPLGTAPDSPRPTREQGGGDPAPGRPERSNATPPPGPPLQPVPSAPGRSPLGDSPRGTDDAAPQARDPSRPSRAARDTRVPGRLSARGRAATYRVRPGDSLWLIVEAQLGPAANAAEIARRVDRLWNLNGIRIGTGDPDLVMPGTVLRLR